MPIGSCCTHAPQSQPLVAYAAQDCTTQQIIDKCISDQDLSGQGYDTPPGSGLGLLKETGSSLVPMNMQA